MARRKKVDKHRQSLHRAADADTTGFDWLGIDLDDARVQMLIEQDHGKGVRHPGLGCCE